MAEPHNPLKHSLWEDVQAFVLGASLCALGVQFLGHASLVTGQTAGLGVLLVYTTGLPFGLWFFLVNLPFYAIGWWRMGLMFTLRSFVAVSLVSAMAEVFAQTISFQTLPIFLAAPIAGALIGLGLIIIFRHGASLGGIGILALVVQEQTGFKAGWFQLGFDLILFAVAAAFLPLPVVGWSLLGAFVTNMIIATNHRKDRYIAR